MTETKKAATTTETKAQSKAKATSEVTTATTTETAKPVNKVNLVKPEKIATTTESAPVITEQVMSNVVNASKLKKKSAGAKIRDIFAKALADGKITADIVKMLLSTDDTKNPHDRKIGGHARYATTVIQIGDKKFRVTNDLYEKQVERFQTWAASLYDEKKPEVKK